MLSRANAVLLITWLTPIVPWWWFSPTSATAATPASSAVVADYNSLARGPWQPVLLPGTKDFIFTLYGAPSDVPSLKRVVEHMREEHLGNGLDPGPAARPANKSAFDFLAGIGWPIIAYPGCADMQIKGGCVLGPADAEALAPLDRANVFNAVQLGEWGYYFHNLSWNESWWKDVYGAQFEAHKHLMKPAGLAGYNHRPRERHECYELLKEYFTSRQHDLLDRVISVTGHSHYESYAAEWGARCIGLELGENIAFTQSKLAFARGASRQWHRPWSVQVSPWFAGACTTSGPLRSESGSARGLDAGHSLSFYERMWLHSWFAGAAMVTPENSMAIFFDSPAPGALTLHGQKAAEVFDFTRKHDRGIPWTPVAIVLDHLAGYNGYMGKPWGILEPTAADREVSDLFDFQLFPGSDHIHVPPDRTNPEQSYLRPTPFGESFDVLLSSVSAETLSAYPAILLAGDIQFNSQFTQALGQAMRHGSVVLMQGRHRRALGAAYEDLQRQGALELLDPWTNPATGRNAVISEQDLRRIAQKFSPVEITGDPIEYQINRVEHGWIVELINNSGIIKKPDQPAITIPEAVAHVRLKPVVPCRIKALWRSASATNQALQGDITVGPGMTEFVELTTR